MSENPPAFPSGDKAAHPTSTFEAGMSLRDYFAGQAIPGILNDPSFREAFTSDLGPRDFAAAAYDIADALLAEREQGA